MNKTALSLCFETVLSVPSDARRVGGKPFQTLVQILQNYIIYGMILVLGTNRSPRVAKQIMFTSAGSKQSSHFCKTRWCSSMYALVNDGVDLVHYTLTNW